MIWSGFFNFLGIILVFFIIVFLFVKVWLFVFCFGEFFFWGVLVLIWVIELILFCLFFRLFGRFGNGDVIRLRGFIIFFRYVFFFFGLEEEGGVGVFVFFEVGV